MFKMTDEVRLDLIKQMEKWQRQLLRTHKVNDPERLPAGCGHVHMDLEFHLKYLRAPEVTEDLLIQRTGGAGTYFRFGGEGYMAHRFIRTEWLIVRDAPTETVWKVICRQGKCVVRVLRTEQDYPVNGDTWLAVLKAIQENNI